MQLKISKIKTKNMKRIYNILIGLMLITIIGCDKAGDPLFSWKHKIEYKVTCGSNGCNGYYLGDDCVKTTFDINDGSTSKTFGTFKIPPQDFVEIHAKSYDITQFVTVQIISNGKVIYQDGFDYPKYVVSAGGSVK